MRLLLALLLADQLLPLQTTGSETLVLGIPPANTAPTHLPGLSEAAPGANKEIKTMSRGRNCKANFAKKKNQKTNPKQSHCEFLSTA